MDILSRHSQPYARAFAAALRADWPIYALALVYVAFGYLHLESVGQSAFGTFGAYVRSWSVNFGVVGPFMVAALGVARIAWRIDRRKRLAYRAMLAPRRVGRFVAGTVLLLTAMLAFTSMFSSVKASFPAAHGFPFDVAQADIDKAIHFGVDPWRLLFAVARHPLVLRIVELNYNVLWFVICYFTLYWVATSPRTDGIRIRYLLTWMLSWIVVGNLMAGTWLSAGPAYYGLVTGDTARFGEQLAFLATTADSFSSAHNFQAYLWTLHTSGLPGIGSGISAFPSMHVALITINALFVGEISRRWALAMWAYVGFVIASSVYLAWHYAIDGYVSVVVVAAIYFGLRRLLPVLARLRWRPLPALAAGSGADAAR